MKITIDAWIDASMQRVWQAWTTPQEITQWNFASDDWCCPSAKLDLRVGGPFCYRMESRNGEVGFDFEGQFTQIEAHSLIGFDLGDGREVLVSFTAVEGGVKVEESFEAEDIHTAEQQRQGWQSILDNFKRHVEML